MKIDTEKKEKLIPSVRGCDIVAVVHDSVTKGLVFFQLSDGSILTRNELKKAIDAGFTKGLVVQNSQHGRIIRTSPDKGRYISLETLPEFQLPETYIPPEEVIIPATGPSASELSVLNYQNKYREMLLAQEQAKKEEHENGQVQGTDSQASAEEHAGPSDLTGDTLQQLNNTVQQFAADLNMLTLK